MKLKINRKQEKTLEKMKAVRAIDSENLRSLIEQKLKWAESERTKGLQQLEELKSQIFRLEGIILFIKDLLQPVKKEEGK